MTLNSRNLLLLDSIGALVTGICLLLIRFVFNGYFGMPPNIVLLLASIAFVFSLFSFSAFHFATVNPVIFLRAISYANLFYCLAIIALLINNKEKLKSVDWVYFIGEMVIILVFVFIERKSIRAK